MELSLAALEAIIQSTWSVAYRRAYDDGYQHGVFAKSGQALPAVDHGFSRDDLLKIEAQVVLAYSEADGCLMRPSAICGDIFNAIWARVRQIEHARAPVAESVG